MNTELLIEKLDRKLLENGQTMKWFIGKYISDKSYQTVMQQKNNFAKIQSYFKDAIRAYLKEA